MPAIKGVSDVDLVTLLGECGVRREFWPRSVRHNRVEERAFWWWAGVEGFEKHMLPFVLVPIIDGYSNW